MLMTVLHNIFKYLVDHNLLQYIVSSEFGNILPDYMYIYDDNTNIILYL